MKKELKEWSKNKKIKEPERIIESVGNVRNYWRSQSVSRNKMI